MEHLKKIKKKALEELEEYGQKKDLSMGDYTTIHMLTDTVKNIDKICMLEEGTYSMDYSMAGGRGGGGGGNSNAGGGGSSNGGGSYGRGGSSNGGGGSYGRSYEGGGSSYEDGYSQQRRDSRGRYSRDEGKMKMIEDLEEMAGRFSDQEWKQLEDFMRRLRSA